MANNDMMLKNTLKELMACLKENECFHYSVFCAGSWMNMRNIKRRGEYKNLCWKMWQFKLERFAHDVLEMPIEHEKVEEINAVQNGFYNGNRMSASEENNIRNTTKNIMNTWIKMEEENLQFFTESWAALIGNAPDVKSVELAGFIKCLLECTQKKLKYIRRKTMDYMAHNYNILVLKSECEEEHDHYKAKMATAHKILDS